MSRRDKASGFWHLVHMAVALVGLIGWYRMATKRQWHESRVSE